MNEVTAFALFETLEFETCANVSLKPKQTLIKQCGDGLPFSRNHDMVSAGTPYQGFKRGNWRRDHKTI
jgi:hypothetical protein